MSEEEPSPIYEPGDVVYGDDPFKGAEAARPWLVVSNHVGQPFHGDQYIALTLTTKTWHEDLVEIPEASWVRGGTPAESRVVPWSVQSIGSGDIDHWQGTLDDSVVDDAVQSFIDYLG
ncbi:type II toxin-antitoxin system PemK/MazF family toxin [Halobium palmae]|uniref:Type II toxin-antitoxin system PemK/MazF family toxin n=1 Tax=Halobium palmae TaxID=1776492 RepID=A0ABD5RWJ6_9EURY